MATGTLPDRKPRNNPENDRKKQPENYEKHPKCVRFGQKNSGKQRKSDENQRKNSEKRPENSPKQHEKGTKTDGNRCATI